MTSTTYLLRLIQVFMQKRYSREYSLSCTLVQCLSILVSGIGYHVAFDRHVIRNCGKPVHSVGTT